MTKEGIKRKKIEEEKGYVKWLFELSNKEVSIAGGKGASFDEMFNKKFPVPPAFIITAQAFGEFIEKIKSEIDEIIKKTDVDNTKELNENSKKIREIIEKQSFPLEMEHEILEAYEILGTEKNDARIGKDALNILKTAKEPVFVAVRSSATTEDLLTASFAGQQESFLGIKGNSALLEAIKKCFSSLYTPRAIYYREKRGFKHVEALLAVVVQRMINSENSGVLFTKNPIHDDNNVVIEAVFGLGEGIVSGKINPDNYTVSRDLKILDKKIANKKKALVRASSGSIEEVKLTEQKSNQQVLTDGEIARLADIGLQIEKHYKKPQDIEFAIENREIYIVQSRPITTSAKGKAREIEGKVLLQGLGASPGIASGKVRIVKDMSDLDKVKKGEIFVTEMTNPDMIVTMQKSDAIITDEGGTTCIEGDAKILTNFGFIQMRDIENLIKSKEIYTLSLDSSSKKIIWRKILRTFIRKAKVLEIFPFIHPTGKFEDSIKITPDHEIIFLNGDNIDKKSLDEFLYFDNKFLTITKIPQFNFSTSLSKLDINKLMYIAGAIFSDGYIEKRKSGRPMRIKFTQKETTEKEEFISTVKNYFYDLFGAALINYIKPYTKIIHSSGYETIRASTFECSRAFPSQILYKIKENIVGLVLNLEKDALISFLAGFIDGDGHFNKEKSWVEVYIDKKTKNLLEAILIACFRIGVIPRLRSKSSLNLLILSNNINQILERCKRVYGRQSRIEDFKLFSYKQLLKPLKIEDWRGNLWTYNKKDILVGINWLLKYLGNHADKAMLEKLNRIMNSDISTIRIKKGNCKMTDVFNIEIEAESELEHNYIVFTKNNYTPIIVGNCHAAIVSREMGIPAVVGTKSATSLLQEGQIVTVDGTSGKVYEGKVGEEKKEEILPIIETKTKIKVILDLPDFAERAAKTKCKDVGLLRLEGIIAESGKHPLMFLAENRLEAYSKLLEKGIEKIAEHFESVWVRTSDIRTDEFRNLEGSPKQIELNPMLGFHGIRFSLKNKAILEAEILAIKKIAEKFPKKQIGVMLPQIISVEEVKEAKKIFEKFKKENMKFGIMVETPAACEIIEDLCDEGIEFISFGTNDLTQYTLAVDRGNENVQNIYNEMHPSVLKQIEKVINICKEKGVETSICGQAASRPEMAKFLVEKGINSISVNADAAYEISKLVQQLEQEKPEQEQSVEEAEEKEEKKEKAEEEIEKKKKEIKEQETKKKETSQEITEETGKQEEFPDIDIGIDVFNPTKSDLKIAGAAIPQTGPVVGSVITQSTQEKNEREEYPNLGIELDFLNPLPMPVPEPMPKPMPQLEEDEEKKKNEYVLDIF